MSKNYGQHQHPVSQELDFEQGLAKTTMDSPISYSDSPQPSTPDPAGAPGTPKIKTSLKGVEIAKKRLRAFSIQKKAPIVPTLPKPPTVPTASTTVLIGKLSSTKVAPKLPPPKLVPLETVDLEKKPPKPPKPGTFTGNSYMDLQNRTMAEIEYMKRRMEMVELGIPLGVICPSPHNKLTPSKAMPTKAMPPIRVLAPIPKAPVLRKKRKKKVNPEDVVTTSKPEKIDEIIREAKKAKAEGKEFKFDYNKFVPGYDNPFQRKQRDDGKQLDDKSDILEKLKSKYDKSRSHSSRSDRDRYTDRKNPDRHEIKKYIESRSKSDSREDHKKDDRGRNRDKTRESDKNRSKDRDKDKSKDRDKDRSKDKSKEKEEKKIIKIQTETKRVEGKLGKNSKDADLNLNEYLVCDSWSLDTEDKMETTSPKLEGITDDIKKIDNTKIDENKKAETEKVDKNKKVDAKKVDECKKKDDTTSDYMQVDEKIIKQVVAVKEEIDMAFKNPMEIFRESLLKKKREQLEIITEPFIQKLKPVVDSFTFEIDDGMLDTFDDTIDLKKYAHSNKTLKKSRKDFDQDSQTSKDMSVDMTDDFLESVISEIKQENMSDDETSHDKGLVEYEMSPEKSPDDNQKPSTPEHTNKMKTPAKCGSITPEIKQEMSSQRSDVSDSGFKSVESGYKSYESGYKSTETVNSSDGYSLEDVEKELDEAMEKVSQATLDSLDTWSFVLKICQPLLFRHDRNKCYKETRATPKLWYTENPKLCDCVKDRSVVYEELDACKIALVDRVYGCDQMEDAPFAKVRNWYPKLNDCLLQTKAVELSTEWETEDSTQNSETTAPNKALEEKTEDKEKKDRKNTPQSRTDDISLDREYQRFMDAVWPEISEPKKDSRSTTPTKEDGKKKKKKEDKEDRKKAKKMKHCESWSVDLEVQEDDEKSNKRKVGKKEDKTRKRKRSSSTISESTDPGDEEKKIKKRLPKKKTNKKGKVKATKRLKMEKKYLKKLKEKQKKKAKKLKEKAEKIAVESEEEKEAEKVKKSKKKKQQKLKKKLQKKKKAQSYSSSESSSEFDSDSESHSEKENKIKKKTKKKDEEGEKSRKKKKKDKKKKRKYSTSESAQSDELFDVNVLNNIKTEKLEAEASENVEEIQEFSPRRQETPRREIINMKELQNDFVTNNIHIKQEVIENSCKESPVVEEEVDQTYEFDLVKESPAVEPSSDEKKSPEFKEPQESKPQPIRSVTEESNLSQASSQESVCSVKEPSYEKDDSHLRPSSQNSNYSFNDVIASQTGYYQKSDDDVREDYQNYEMYERLAMEYQSGVANLQSSEPTSEDLSVTNRIETVVSRGEIKCDWRAGDKVQRAPPRPSRWGLKPGEANIVLTGTNTPDEKVYQIRSVLEQDTYRIESITGHGNDSVTGYDEAYADMYAASDRLQYGDCFTEPPSSKPHETGGRSSLDARIEKVLSEAAKAEKNKADKSNAVTKPKTLKRVSFADGYKPGQDSDTEEPPTKKKKRSRRTGCAWPCPATHPDHVPLWDALPPPPPPPGSPPPPITSLPPLHLLRQPPMMRDQLMPPMPHPMMKFDPTGTIPGILPPEPPPGMLNLQHLQM